MFESVAAQTLPVSVVEIVFNAMIAFVLGLSISFLYRYTHKGLSYSISFVHTLVMLSMVTSIVMMVIGNSIARAFSLVGAMSIIRFRTAVKDTRDTAFVFFSLAAGMAAGAGHYKIALFGSAIIGFFIVLMYFGQMGEPWRRSFLLRFQVIPDDTDEEIYQRVLDRHLKKCELINIRSARMGEMLEVSYRVRFDQRGAENKLVAELSALEGLARVTLIRGEIAEEGP